MDRRTVAKPQAGRTGEGTACDFVSEGWQGLPAQPQGHRRRPTRHELQTLPLPAAPICSLSRVGRDRNWQVTTPARCTGESTKGPSSFKPRASLPDFFLPEKSFCEQPVQQRRSRGIFQNSIVGVIESVNPHRISLCAACKLARDSDRLIVRLAKRGTIPAKSKHQMKLRLVR